MMRICNIDKLTDEFGHEWECVRWETYYPEFKPSYIWKCRICGTKASIHCGYRKFYEFELDERACRQILMERALG
jgi:hypothetical protein